MGYNRTLITIGLFFLFNSGLKGQHKNDRVDSTGINFETSKSYIDFPYDKLVKSLPPNVSIIGLGEGTHGTSEFFKIKSQIIKNLVNQGFNKFLLEAGEVECNEINIYINNGTLSIDSLLIRLMPWPWACTEFKELVEWMRNYNLFKNEEDKIHFYGMDICSKQFLEKKSSAFYGNQTANKLVQEALSVYNDTKLSVRSKRKRLKSIKNKHLKQSGKNDKEYFVEANILASAYVWTHTGGRLRGKREAALFEMVKKIKETTLAGSKFILWAHNEHITQKSNDRKSLGFFLDKEYKKQYQTIGFDFNKGNFTATDIDSLNFGKTVFGVEFNRQAPQEAFVNQVSSLNKGVLCIDLTLQQNRETLCNRKKFIQSIGAVYAYRLATQKPQLYLQKINLCKSFNYLFIVENATASHLLVKNRK